MVTGRIMEEIRSLLSEGRSSKEVIAMGFRPRTVYRVKREWARNGQKPPEEKADEKAKTHGEPEAESIADPIASELRRIFEKPYRDAEVPESHEGHATEPETDELEVELRRILGMSNQEVEGPESLRFQLDQVEVGQ